MPAPFMPKTLPLPQKRRPLTPYDDEDENAFINRANTSADDADLEDFARARAAAAKSSPQVGDVAAQKAQARANAPTTTAPVGGYRHNGSASPDLAARASALADPLDDEGAPPASSMRQRLGSIGESASKTVDPEQQSFLKMRADALADDSERADALADDSDPFAAAKENRNAQSFSGSRGGVFGRGNDSAGSLRGTFDRNAMESDFDNATDRNAPTLGEHVPPKRGAPVPAAAQPGEPEDPELAAAREQYDADAARHQQDIGARAGMGGFGLFGGTSTALADASRADTRNETTGLADLKRKIGDDHYNDLRRQALLDDAEDSLDEDVDGDGDVGGRKVGGNIGDGDPSNDHDDGDKGSANKPPKYDDEVNFGGDRPKRHGFEGTALNPDDYTETTSVHPPIDQYEGSDEHYDYYISHVDGKEWKVPRAKKGSPGTRA
jgi:hypothetical protein